MTQRIIRRAVAGDEPGAYHVCLKTGDHGDDGEALYRDDPDALGRILRRPYLAFEPELSLMLEDDEGICGYALGAFDSRGFYARYEAEWRPQLCARFPAPPGDPAHWTRSQQVHHCVPPSGLLLSRAIRSVPFAPAHRPCCRARRGAGTDAGCIERLTTLLRDAGSPGAHLGVSPLNARAHGFYTRTWLSAS